MSAIGIIIVSIILLTRFGAIFNAGIFVGYGHTVKLISTSKIQLLNETILINSGTSWVSKPAFNGNFQHATFDCKFLLANLTDSSQRVTCGFPLNSQFFILDYPMEELEPLIDDYQFTVISSGKQLETKFFREDIDGEFKSIFLWDLSFEPNEQLILEVKYRLGNSVGLSLTCLDYQARNYERPWLQKLEECYRENIGYVTETAKSWHGPIEKAEFTVSLEKIEKCFDHPFEDRRIVYENDGKEIIEEPILNPIVFRKMTPPKWVCQSEHIYKLEIENSKPEENLHFVYYHLRRFPKGASDAKRLISFLSQFDFSLEDYDLLKYVFMAFNGDKVDNPELQSFLSNQIWFKYDCNRKVPQEVFNVIEDEKIKFKNAL